MASWPRTGAPASPSVCSAAKPARCSPTAKCRCRCTVNRTGEKLADARVKAQHALANARAAVALAETIAVERAKAGAQVVDQSVHENPWAAVGVAAGIGLLVGWMLGRR